MCGTFIAADHLRKDDHRSRAAAPVGQCFRSHRGGEDYETFDFDNPACIVRYVSDFDFTDILENPDASPVRQCFSQMMLFLFIADSGSL